MQEFSDPGKEKIVAEEPDSLPDSTYGEKPRIAPDDLLDELRDDKQARGIIGYMLFGAAGFTERERLTEQHMEIFLKDFKTAGSMGPLMDELLASMTPEKQREYRAAQERLLDLAF